MQKDFLTATTSVLNLMKCPDSPCKDISSHETCYTAVFKYLMHNGLPFTIDASLEWLKDRKTQVGNETYTKYRNALFRLEHYLYFGNVNAPFCRSEEDFFCKSGMSESFYRLTFELRAYYDVAKNKGYYMHYSVAFKAFFRHATSTGVHEPEAITINTLISFWDYCHGDECPVQSPENAVCAMTVLMQYLHQRGDVPACYRLALFASNAEKLKTMRVKNDITTFHPSIALENRTTCFLDSLDEWQYSENTKSTFANALSWYFMFLELNGMAHSDDAIAQFESALPKYPKVKKISDSPSSYRLHVVKMFNNFLKGSMNTNIVNIYRQDAFDILPEWSCVILKEFMKSRNLDGMTESTISMCQCAGRRFFLFLEQENIQNCNGITPEVVVAFHNQDEHSSPESKNAYSIKLRQLLRFMADQELVPATLEYAVPTNYAPRRNIVDVLSDDMVDRIYEYRKNAAEPLELRDIAIVMLGLRMGIRGSDILNLKLDNFNWKEKTVSFIQQKTQTAITLPVPTDVGNTIYKYITKGRPKSAAEGNGYIFIHHLAPYVPLKVTTACRGALKRVLSAYGYKLEKGQGFHMTRKTFATNLLRSRNRIDDISNVLGHARQATAEVYLERDEDGMRQCPLDFGGALS